jgi:hypothetical protein
MNFRSLLSAALLVILAIALAPPAARAADETTINLNRLLGHSVGRYVATDQSIAIRIQYIGTSINTDGSDRPRVDVNAGGDLVFTVDGAADTGIGLPTANGTIDVSDASANTFGEVVDGINASTNWRAILVDVLPSTSANNTLTSTTIGAGTTLDRFREGAGHPLAYNTADLDMLTAAIGPEYTSDAYLNISDILLNRRSTPLGVGRAPFWRSEVYKVTANATFSSGAPNLQIYAVESDSAGATEVLLWSQVGAATTEDGTIDFTDVPPLKVPRGFRLVIGCIDTSTPDISAGFIRVHGLTWNE